MQIKKISKDNRGITLVEIMVGMLIFAIITMTVIVIMYPTLNSIHKTRELSEMGMFADNIAAEISNDIKMAESIEVKKAEASKPDSVDTLTLTTHENKIIYSTVDVYGRIKRNYDDIKDSDGKEIFSDVVSSKYYENKSVKVSYDDSYAVFNKTVKGEKISIGCKIKIEIFNTENPNKDDEPVITREYSVMSLILQDS
ncbi:MAG: prepilin-type N-terminal cleavage/methylation domain-containing protein [Proteocatella sp.]